MRRPTLYKQYGTWYARFWDDKEKKYHSRSLGVPVEGKKKRKDEARRATEMVETENKSLQVVNLIASMPLIEYVFNFWRPDSEYVREKSLLEKKPHAAHYLLTNRRMVETKMKPFPGFARITLNELSKPIIRQWKLWLAEQGHSGRMINGALLAPGQEGVF